MNNFFDIVSRRTAPGILLFDPEYRLLYSNREAADMLAAAYQEKSGEIAIPSQVYQLCRQLRRKSETTDSTRIDSCYPVLQFGAVHCSLRGFVLDSKEVGEYSGHVMVLMERIVEKHEVDMDKARLQFQLTKREAEVVRLVCRGLGNREISEKIFISEYTVKDHIKNVMKKMQAGSRNEIVALLT